MKLLEKHRSFKGYQEVYTHKSEVTNCDMQFAVYSPDNSKDAPTLFFLSGVTCTEQNFIQKSGFQQYASKYQVAIVVPDTSPRGENIPDSDNYKLGSGAGFYVNATKSPWSRNYNMYDYVTKELPKIIANNHAFSHSKVGIFGHSMGGGGAIQCALKNDLFKSVSAFSPIWSLIYSSFSQDMFANYLNSSIDELNKYDPINLIKVSKKKLNNIKIDVGLSDKFLKDLFIDKFTEACKSANQKISLNKHEGYDHGYYFISSFIEQHIKYHYSILQSN